MRGPAMFGAHPLVRTANPRLAAQRRWRVVLAILGLALAGGVIGSLTHPGASLPVTGPFSYFPHQ